MMISCVFVTFPCGILGQVCYLIVSIPDLCRLSCFNTVAKKGGIAHTDGQSTKINQLSAIKSLNFLPSVEIAVRYLQQLVKI